MPSKQSGWKIYFALCILDIHFLPISLAIIVFDLRFFVDLLLSDQYCITEHVIKPVFMK